MMRATAIMRTQRDRVWTLRGVIDRNALHLVPEIDRHALGMTWQIGQQHQHAEAILDLFTHSDDAAAADFKSRVARVRQRFDAVLYCARGDDLPVKFWRCVYVVIVEIEPRRLKPLGLS